MKKICYSALVCIFLTAGLFCVQAVSSASQVDTAQTFSRANALYKANNYDEAIAEYQKIIDSGYESANLYYNLGNCFVKKDDLARSLLNYERAKVLNHHDSDLKSNYDYVRSLLNLGGAPRLGFEALNIDMLYLAMSALYIFAVIILLFSLFIPGLRKMRVQVIIVTAALFFITALAFNRELTGLKENALILAKDAEVNFEPLAGSTVFFKLNQGDKVQVIDNQPGWSKIRRQDKKTGWVEQRLLELINP